MALLSGSWKRNQFSVFCLCSVFLLFGGAGSGSAQTTTEAAAAVPTFTHAAWLLWGIGVGVTSSVLPYVADQLAMARLARATYALMLSLLPATATIIGLVVLAQVPTVVEVAGIALVIFGVGLHREDSRAIPTARPERTASVARVPGHDELRPQC